MLTGQEHLFIIKKQKQKKKRQQQQQKKNGSILIMGSKIVLIKIIGTIILLKISKVKSPGTHLGLCKSWFIKWPEHLYTHCVRELQLRRLTPGGDTSGKKDTKKGVCQGGVGSPNSMTFLSQSPSFQKYLPCTKLTTPALKVAYFN